MAVVESSGLRRKKRNLKKNEYLDLALEALARQGQSPLRLGSLFESMPVTSGSFYHHFSDKKDFLAAVVRHWDEIHTQGIIDELGRLGSSVSPQDRLWALLTAIEQGQLTRFDGVIRAMSVGDPELSALVEQVDRKRIAVVQGLFEEMGFSGAELRMRTRVFVIAVSQDRSVQVAVPGAERQTYLKDLHAFFIRP